MIAHARPPSRHPDPSSPSPARGGLLQRKCACGGSASSLSECEACCGKRISLQAKLAIGAADDAYEQEAERVADAVMGMSQTGVPGRAPSPRLQRQPADAGPEPAPAEKKEGAPAEGEAQAQPQSQPVCSPKGMSRDKFLKEPGASTKEFGLTALGLSAVTYPELVTEKAKGGVRIKPTAAALPTIPSVYTGSDTFTEGEAHFLGQNEGECASKKYPIRWTITPQGATKIGEGEQEHCADFQHAFDISLKRYAEAVNALAGTTHGSEKKAEKAVVKKIGAAPADWRSIFSCLARKSLLRDSNWHTPKPTTREPKLATNCAFVSAFVTGSSLPQVGQHASADIIKDCAESGAASGAKGNKVNMPDMAGAPWDAWEEDESALLQRKSAGETASAAAPMARVQQTLAAPGRPLDAPTRAFMESRFGHDFERVRIHVDARAAESAAAISALAYTAGEDIAFASNQYDPASAAGRHLLAHELTHVVQQGQTIGGRPRLLNLGSGTIEYFRKPNGLGPQ